MSTGVRFKIDDLDLEPKAPADPFAFVGDIVEKPIVAGAAPPAPPTLKPGSTGFPTPKKRVSAFAQRRRDAAAAGSRNAPPVVQTIPTGEKPATVLDRMHASKEEIDSINAENEKRIADMSIEEIEEARNELLKGLNGSLIERFLNRSTSAKPAPKQPAPKVLTEAEMSKENETPKEASKEIPKDTSPPKASESSPEPRSSSPPASISTKPAAIPVPNTVQHSFTPSKVQRITNLDSLDPSFPRLPPDTLLPPPVKTHYPAPPQPAVPDPDPDSPQFLENLKSKYFPNLPTDPSKLSWMAPLPSSEASMGYDPSLSSLLPSSLRFDFKGRLLPPRKALELPTHLGLHHHGDAPGAAGYTIPELAHLARSSFPAQRCMAMQTLGRIMYRLGQGEFGEDVEGDEGVVYRGLWKCLNEGRVLDGLNECAAKEGGHLGVKCYAIEALWNWERGRAREQEKKDQEVLEAVREQDEEEEEIDMGVRR
ncbi:hypothetical protein BJ508DRAFT_411390 [Ascobolus immersus RN42]|uniref:Uncharacterized protein n=1 Tax=Ascobolus immersus RN42 TaxID=1160509 RepID=A0A3N4IJ76_ASCIM|nr:hypothetical protein BJ508DRAFT_411390 [Ascobolus immersus RN42]